MFELVQQTTENYAPKLPHVVTTLISCLFVFQLAEVKTENYTAAIPLPVAITSAQNNTFPENKLTSKPNERWCRIFLGFPFHPVTPLFFFFNFPKKCRIFFSIKLTVKNFGICFCNEFSSKKFFNSLKMSIKNFRNFFQ